ncbi:hypothetical protein [Thermodesulfovibrio yellowstonii]|uniref:hypothetical protein n=1 Tax=Thermodesulfovibrio yellowstonii TaxID=28262 RepID=UPI0024B3C52D|nr:hypothetical protein [Thermodesulfovibrio yellowstonii]MDI6865294.1 hypothetical protein [Thermodesulfovibrio yellowstonii]
MLELIKSYFSDYDSLKEIAERCLNTERWNGNVLLMLLDVAITSVGVNYFQVVVPKVREFEKDFAKTGKVNSLSNLAHFNYEEAFHIWRNVRSWQVLKEIAGYLSTLSDNDREALRTWAKGSSLSNWKSDPIGKIKGVGLITYQYLRMMGGIDTVMPDKIVKRVINEILIKAGEKPVYDDMEFIYTVEALAKQTGYKAVELCFMTWFVNNPERIYQMP